MTASTQQFRSADEHFEQINVMLTRLQEQAETISAAAEQQSVQVRQISNNVNEMAASVSQRRVG